MRTFMKDAAMPVAENNGNKNVISSVETSISIVECLQEHGVARVGEIAEATGNSKSNVSKHLATLRKHGFTEKTPEGYKLALRYLDLGGFVRNSTPYSHVIKPKIRELAEITGEVAQFAVEHQGRSVMIYRETGNQGVSTRTRVGRYLPIHQVASGKAMLAHLPRERVESIIDTYGLPAETENTITDKEALFDELEEVKQNGIATNNAESTIGLYAIASPIKMSGGELVGACAVSGPAHRIRDDEKIEEISDTLLGFVNEIELNIKYS
jgi:DNA-binding IclR family transcriptional regulator